VAFLSEQQSLRYVSHHSCSLLVDQHQLFLDPQCFQQMPGGWSVAVFSAYRSLLWSPAWRKPGKWCQLNKNSTIGSNVDFFWVLVHYSKGPLFWKLWLEIGFGLWLLVSTSVVSRVKFMVRVSRPYMSTDFGRHAFSYSSPATWNSIPISNKNCSSLYSFKRHLKSHFIAQLINS